MIETNNLVYVYPDDTVGIFPSTFSFPSGSRTLLIGANGAGKSTLLRVLAGKTLAKAGTVKINGKDPFRDHIRRVTYLGTEWAANPVVRQDISAKVLIESVGGNAYPDRRDLLINILDIDINWRLHAVSDGERRRVQLAMGLIAPWDILLLDEVTVDLDVLSRSRLLEFLKRETESRPCQIVYATHIFDGLGGWPTHLAHLSLGHMKKVQEYDHHHGQKVSHDGNTHLLEMVLDWLQKDYEQRGPRVAKTTFGELESQWPELFASTGSGYTLPKAR